MRINADGLKRESESVMKKVALLVLSIAILMCLVACNQGQSQDPTPEHTHNFGEWSVTKNATCTEDGKMVRYCSCGESQTEAVPLTGHTEVVDAALEATCTGTGLTEGKHCSECGEIIVVQQKTSKLAHTYDDDYDEDCNVCGHERIIECPHVETEVVEGKVATCAEEGLTEGVKCKTCGEFLVAQSTIPALEHNETDWIVDKEETKSEDGKRHTECTSCGQTVKEEILYATGSVGMNYTLKSDGKSYFVKNIGTCTDTDIIIPSKYNGLPVTSIGGNAFYDQDLIKSVTIPNTVTSIAAYAFYGCDYLENIIIPASVTNIDSYAFYSCDLLADISIPNSVTNIGDYAFGECVSFTSLVIPDSVVSIGDYAFWNCKSLKDITLGNGVTNIGSNAFGYCFSLASIIIPNSVASIGGHAFYSCSKLTNVYYTGAVEEWVGISFANIVSNPLYTGAKLFFDGELVSEITISKGVTSIGDYAFSYCDTLKRITIGDGVTSIGNSAFSYCNSLKSITIPDSVTSIGNSAFYECGSLKDVTIGDGVTSIGGSAFSKCISLERVIIPNSVTVIGSYAFERCTSLRIYCEAESKPSGWASSWNYNDRPVVWDYTGD